MSTEGLKLEIIQWLASLKDRSTLEYLKVVKDSSSQTSDWWKELTDDQKTRINAGLEDASKGYVTPHEEVKAKYGL